VKSNYCTIHLQLKLASPSIAQATPSTSRQTSTTCKKKTDRVGPGYVIPDDISHYPQAVKIFLENNCTTSFEHLLHVLGVRGAGGMREDKFGWQLVLF